MGHDADPISGLVDVSKAQRRPLRRRRGARRLGMLLIDAANVIGARPTGWWRDRAGAARQLVDQVRDTARRGRLPLPVVVVLEGDARDGAKEADVADVRVVHAARSGDDALVDEVAGAGPGVVVVSADRGLRARVESLGATTVGPSWLYDRL